MGKKIDLEIDFFKVLGVKASSSDEEVKKAYKALAKQWHPDKNNEEGAEEQFKVISAAYETLKSADERSIYRREREQAKREAEREQKRQRQREEYYQPSSSDGSRFKTSFFFKTGDGSGRNHKTYSSGGSDSWRYHGREESPFNDRFNGFKTKNESHSEKKNKKNSKQRKPWSQNWNDPGDDDDFKPFGNGFSSFNRSNFSTAFNSFVDDLFSFKSFFGGNDPFESFFKKYDNIFEHPSEKKPPKKEYTYYATFGDDGKPSQNAKGNDKENRPQNGRQKDSTPGFSFDDYPDEEEEQMKYECICCGKKFAVYDDMVRHEVVCKEVNGKANGTKRMNRIPVYTKAPGDWRSTHENLLQNLRNLRRSSQTRVNEEEEEEDREPSPRQQENDYEKCLICGRTFNRPTMERHQLYCQMRYNANCGEPDDTNIFYTREQYPRSMPHPSSGLSSGRPQSAGQGSDSPRTARTTTPSHYSSRTCFPNLSSRHTMEDPFLFTSTGLHTHRSSSRPQASPRVQEFRFSSKGANNFGFPSSPMGFQEDRKHLTRNQCPNCRSVYARNARYCISCGFKRPG